MKTAHMVCRVCGPATVVVRSPVEAPMGKHDLMVSSDLISNDLMASNHLMVSNDLSEVPMM